MPANEGRPTAASGGAFEESKRAGGKTSTTSRLRKPHENHNGPAFYRTTIRDGEIWAEGTDTTEAAEADAKWKFARSIGIRYARPTRRMGVRRSSSFSPGTRTASYTATVLPKPR